MRRTSRRRKCEDQNQRHRDRFNREHHDRRNVDVAVGKIPAHNSANGAQRTFAAHGADVRGVPVDAEGLCVGLLRKLAGPRIEQPRAGSAGRPPKVSRLC
jgi:hypothetical protein